MKYVLFAYLAAVSLFAVAVTVFDKLRAMRHGRRVSEKNLILISLFGGSAAMFLTMLLIRHKIRKKRFMLGIPAIILVQAAACYFTWRALHA